MDFIACLSKLEHKHVIWWWWIHSKDMPILCYVSSLINNLDGNCLYGKHLEASWAQIIISARDPIFTNYPRKDLFTTLGTKLAHNCSYHPQSCGYNKVVSKCIQGNIYCFTYDKQS
jgi:hypothetical protein